MPTYEVTDEVTQNTLRIQGDSPPTQAELEEIFSQDSLARIYSPGSKPATLRTTPPKPESINTSEGFATAKGGPRVPVASFSETIAEPSEALTEPRIDLPEAKITESDNPVSVVGKEVWNIAKGIPEFASSDIGVTSLVAAPAAPTAAGAVFGATMFYDLGKQALSTYQNWDKLSRNQKIKAVVDMVGTGIMGATAAKRPAEMAYKSLAPETVKAVQGPPAMGSMLKTPEGAPADGPVPPEVQANVDLAPLTTAAVNEVETKAPELETKPTVAETITPVVETKPVIPETPKKEVTVDDAETLIRSEGKASVLLIQRRFKLGYAKAVALMDELEKKGVVGPHQGMMPREIFPKPETKGEITDANQIQSPVEVPGGETPGTPAQVAAREAGQLEAAPGAQEATQEITPQPASEAVAKVEDKVQEVASTEGQPYPETPPSEIIGMGGAVSSEFGAGGAGPDIYGIAERVRKERALAGQVADVKRGVGIAPADSVERGRELLAKGNDPEKALTNFEQTRRFSSDDMAIVRAHGEELARAARRIEEKFGTESPEYMMAWKALSDWDSRSKAMQTEWHRSGQAQQGETDIDTGTFTGLQRAYKEATGKDFTKGQAGKAERIATNVRSTDAEAQAAREKLFEQAGKEEVSPQVRTLAERLTAALEKSAASALERIKARRAEGRLFAAGIDPEQLGDYAIYGASKIAKGAVEFGAWSAEMVKDLGEYIRPHLKQIWEAADKTLDEQIATVAPEAKEQVKRAVKPTAEPFSPGQPMTPGQVRTLWAKVREYLDQGETDFDDIRHKIATDLGLPVDDVTKGLAQKAGTKRLTDDMWRKQQQARKVKSMAKRWLQDQATPGYLRALQKIPGALFRLKVGLHGTVALGTHAPMVAFQPRFWNVYAKNFGRMYRMVGSKAYYEQRIQDLMRRPNYIEARRAGLVNDPAVHEDFTSPETAKYFGWLSGSGNRGYTVLKLLRQDMFDQMWEKYPSSIKTPEVAKALADHVNHATGVVQGKAPKGSNLILFAPRLLGSRVMWLGGDPLRAAKAVLNWRNAEAADKTFAIEQMKEKAWVFGTMYSMLALNQGILSMMGSKQKINLDDPMRRDWLRFKSAGMEASYGGAMLALPKLGAKLYRIRQSDGGKMKNLVYPDEDSAKAIAQYIRSQLSPFAGLATTLWLKADYQNRPLPNSTRPVPKRLRAKGVEPYTWPEFWSEELAMIPLQEALKEVWGNMGATPEEQDKMLKAMAIIMGMAATGGRISEDVDVQ